MKSFIYDDVKGIFDLSFPLNIQFYLYFYNT